MWRLDGIAQPSVALTVQRVLRFRLLATPSFRRVTNGRVSVKPSGAAAEWPDRARRALLGQRLMRFPAGNPERGYADAYLEAGVSGVIQALVRLEHKM